MVKFLILLRYALPCESRPVWRYPQKLPEKTTDRTYMSTPDSPDSDNPVAAATESASAFAGVSSSGWKDALDLRLRPPY